MTKHYKIPVTLTSKIKALKNHTCTQVIRKDQKINKKDEISFFTWSGKPYKSNWSWQSKTYTVIETIPIVMFPEGLFMSISDSKESYFDTSSLTLQLIAQFEGIDPPSGEMLMDILNTEYPLTIDGTEGQIIQLHLNE